MSEGQEAVEPEASQMPALTPRKAEELAKLETGPDAETLEQKQMRIQKNLFSQVHVLTRELGDWQKQFLSFGQEMNQKVDDLRMDVQNTQEEASSALRSELAANAKKMAEVKEDLSKAIQDGLARLSQEHEKALGQQASTQSTALAEMEKSMASKVGKSDDAAAMQKLLDEKLSQHTAALEKRLEDVTGKLSLSVEQVAKDSNTAAMASKLEKLEKELAELRSSNAKDATQSLEGMTSQVDKVNSSVEKLAKDVKDAQKEAHAALLEISEQGKSATEMKAAWETAHKELTKALEDGLAKVAADQVAEHAKRSEELTKALESSSTAQAQASEGHASASSKLQQEIAELRSGSADSVKKIMEDVKSQVVAVEQLEKEVQAAQESSAAAQAKALEEHAATQAKALQERATAHDAALVEIEKKMASKLESHNGELAKHTAALDKGGQDYGKLQQELAELRSGHASDVKQIMEDVKSQVGKVTSSLEQLEKDVKASQEEAQTTLLMEVAGQGKSATEMKTAWEEAHNVLSKTMEDKFAKLAAEQAQASEDHAKALGEHATAQKKALEELAGKHAKGLEEHSTSLSQMEKSMTGNLEKFNGDQSAKHDLQNTKLAEHAAALDRGLNDVSSKAQKDLSELRSSHEADVKQIMGDMNSQVDKLKISVEQLAKDVKIAQDEANSALHVELAAHGKSAAEMKVAMEEAHTGLAKAMDDRHSNLALEQAKMSEEHSKALADKDTAQAAALQAQAEAQAKALQEHAAAHGASLAEMEKSIAEKFAKLNEEHDVKHDLHKESMKLHTASVENNLEEIRGRLQQELTSLQSTHDADLKEILGELNIQVDKLTFSMEQMAKDMTSAREQGHSDLRGELAAHGKNAAEMKVALEEAHGKLSKSMEDSLTDAAAKHAKALEDHTSANSTSLAELDKKVAGDFATFKDQYAAKEELHNEKHAQHTVALEKGLKALENVINIAQGRQQEEMAKLRTSSTNSLKQLEDDLSSKINSLRKDMEQMSQNMTEEWNTTHKALIAELVQHGKNAEEMQSSFEKANSDLASAMDDGLGKLATEHAKVSASHAKLLEETAASHEKALEEHKSAHAAALAEHAESHSSKLKEHEATLGKGLEDVHSRLTQDLTELRTEHASKLEQTSATMNSRVDDVTLSMVQLGKNMTEAQEDAHSQVLLQLAEHGKNAEEMKATFEAAHNDLSKSMTDGHEKLAADQAKNYEEHAKALEELGSAQTKALEEQASAQTKALEEHASTHASALADTEKSMMDKLAKFNDAHSANHDLLRSDLAEHGKTAEANKVAAEEAHKELAKTMDDSFTSMAETHAKALLDHKTAQDEMNGKIMVDVAGQIDTVTLSMMQLGNNVKETQDAAEKNTKEAFEEQGRIAAETQAAWEERHSAMSKSMDENFSKVSADHAKAHEELSTSLEEKSAAHTKALEDHAAAHAKALAEHAEAHGARLSDVETTMSSKHAEMKGAWDHMFDGWKAVMDKSFQT